MKTMRGPNPMRNVRQNIETRTEAPSRTAYLEDEPHIQAIEQLLPQIAAESEQAAKTARVVFLYFRRKLSGRRCSCHQVEATPDGQCQICYGAGYVGGWDMHGCRTEILDITYPNLRLVNVKAAFDEGIRPTPFMLEDGCKKGFIEAEVNLVRNVKVAQYVGEFVGGKMRGVNCKVLIRSMTETTFVPLTAASLEARLGEFKVMIRVELSRNHVGLPSPKFSHLHLRYQLIPDVRMYGDMNLAEESQEVGDMGFNETFTTLALYVPRLFDRFQVEDFLIRLSDRRRFKVTRYERNCISEILLSTMVRGRLLVKGQDSLTNFP